MTEIQTIEGSQKDVLLRRANIQKSLRPVLFSFSLDHFQSQLCRRVCFVYICLCLCLSLSTPLLSFFCQFQNITSFYLLHFLSIRVSFYVIFLLTKRPLGIIIFIFSDSCFSIFLSLRFVKICVDFLCSEKSLNVEEQNRL